jgi:hypothetical protein
MFRNYLLFNLWEMRATELSSVRCVVNGFMGVMGVSFWTTEDS